MTEPLRQVLVRMPAGMYAALQRHAESEDRTVAAEIRRLVRQHLEHAADSEVQP